MCRKAYFVHRPRRFCDLCRPHLLDWERSYEIIKTIILQAIDYENFVSDLTVTRDFLEVAAPLCAEAPVFRCVLVCRKNAREGILVVARENGEIAWAAYWSPSI